MKQRGQQDRFRYTDENDERKKNEKIENQQPDVICAKTEVPRAAAGERRAENEQTVAQDMHGKIERKNHERARQLIYGKENNETAAECTGTVKKDDGRYGETRIVHSAKKHERQQKRVARRPLKKYHKDTSLRKTDAV